MHHYRPLCAFLVLFLLLLSISCPALAKDPLYPDLQHPADRYVQSLCAMSQQDSAFKDVKYNKGWLSVRGCYPLALANGVIAAFEITDRETAIAVVMEATKLLTPGGKSQSRAVTTELFSVVIDPEMRAADGEKYPHLAKTVGAYPATVTYIHEVLSADEIIELIKARSAPSIVGSRMYVADTWEDVVRIAYALHELGMNDATITLSRAEVGKNNHGSPLRSGKYGHYLTPLLHVGAFVESGAVYVLDSLPRALEGEECGSILHSRYAFCEDRADNPFNSTFAAVRISPTIIKLYLKEEKLAVLASLSGEARIAEHTALLKPLLLFGPSSMLVALR